MSVTSVDGTSGTNATPQELYALARQAGFQGQNAIIAVAIALAEDPSGQTNILNDTPSTKDYSIGNWQINYLYHKDFGTPQDLTNPGTNAAAAAVLFNSAGGFSPWSTFTQVDPKTGDYYYKAHMAAAQAAAVEAAAVEADFGAIVHSLLERIGLPASGGTGVEPGTAGNPVPGQPTHVAGQATGILGALQGATSAAEAFAKPFAWIGVPGHWWAVAFVAIGLALVVGGLVIYLRPEIEAGTAETMAGLKGFASGQGVSAA